MQTLLRLSLLGALFSCGNAPQSQLQPTRQPSALASAQTTQSAALHPPTKKERKILYDPRALPVQTSLSDKEQWRVLSASFPKRINPFNRCKKVHGSADAIALGQIKPTIVAATKGSFTKKEPQSAYLLNAGECNAEVLRDGSLATSYWLVILSGDEVVYKEKTDAASYLFAVDLDGDGVDELAAIEDSGWKDLIQYLYLYQLSDGAFTRLDSFYEPVLELEVCGAAKSVSEGQPLSASMISFVPDGSKLPVFEREKVALTLEQKRLDEACHQKKTSSPFLKGGG